METYYAYLRWCRDFNERNLIDPAHDQMEWNHTLPQCIFKGHGPGQWLTLRQHAIASALQTLVFQKNCMCGWHKTHMPDKLWEMCRPFYSKMCADNAPEFTHEQRLKGIETMRQNQTGFFNEDFKNDSGKKRRGGTVGGVATYENGVGIWAMSDNDRYEARSTGGQKGGLSGKNADAEYLSERGRKGGASRRRAVCLVTGTESDTSGLTRFQRARGIDTSLRVML